MSPSMCRSCSAKCWRRSSRSAAACSSIARSVSAGTPGAARRGRDARHRDRPRPLGARGAAATPGGVCRARRVRARRLPAAAGGPRRARHRARAGRAGRSRRVVDAVRQRGPRVQLQARRAARHADGPEHGADGGRPGESGRRGRAGRRDLPRSARSGTRAASRARSWRRGPITTTGELAAIVRRAVPTRGWQRIDPATRTFQALRIWVNGELDGLDRFVSDAAEQLEPAGGWR